MVSKFSQWFLKLKDIKQVASSFHVICRIRRVVLLYLQRGLELNLNRIHRKNLKIQLGKGTFFFRLFPWDVDNLSKVRVSSEQ